VSGLRVLCGFARRVRTAVANAETHAAALAAAARFEQALASRAVIDQAKGILIATQATSPDEAFAILRNRAQHENRKLRTVAEEIVDQARRRPWTRAWDPTGA
jgi:AmiR/NasT family two-component response regulator